jgi:hypothetical protein
VFFVCALLFSAILRMGGDLVPAGAGAPLTLVLACLLTWLDARRRERKRAAKVASGILPERSSVPVKAGISVDSAGRALLVFFFWLFLLSFILHFGMGLDPSGDEEYDRANRVQIKVFSVKIPADSIVPPFVYVSAFLLTWVDSRQMARRRAAGRG